MRPLSFLVVAAVLAIASTAQAAGDAAAGAKKVYQCQGCHGIVGWKTAFPEVYHVPKLGGQNAAYIIAALKEYKDGQRDFATMRAVAGTLSDQDMQDIAAYYSGAGSKTASEAPAEKQASGTTK